MRREICGGCGSGDLRQFLDLGSTPLADEFPTAPDLDAARWPLGACVCGSCWLVQLTEVVPDELLWGGDYGFYTGASPSSVDYFEAYAAELLRHLAGGGLTVEVACNDGTLLQHIHSMGFRALGVEPAKGPAEAARARGLDVVEEPFGREVAQAIVDTEGQASLVVANNVLAHVADLDDFVGGLALLLAPDGVLVVEVQYVGDLLLGNGFDLVYHEHRSFFSLASLTRVLARHGLDVVDVQRTPAQGGTLRVTAGRGVRPESSVSALRLAEHRAGLNLAIPEMQGRATAVRDRLRELVAAERAAGRTVVGYGAPAKATTLLNWCRFGPDDITKVYDATPSKNGRYVPGTGIPITTAAHDTGDAGRVTALLLAHNYLGGVVRRERAFVDAGGRFLVPLPVPVLL